MIREQEKQFNCSILNLSGILVKDLKGIVERREGSHADGIVSKKGGILKKKM